MTGKVGLSVRTATKGTPSEYLSILNEETYRSYNAGSFSIGGNSSQALMDSPDRIYEYPVRYYYRHFAQPGKKTAFIIARVVYAGFDYSFYQTGELTRPGNYIVHLFLFEEAPKKEVFDLLYGQPRTGSNEFLPKDYSPRIDNKEMISLMLGNPTPLPEEEKPFTSSCKEIPLESFDLFFSYLEALNRNIPLVVKTKAADAAKICAGLFRLLPSSIAKEATFEINHQEQGTPIGSRITFINEFYKHPVAKVMCEYVDYLTGERQASAMEKFYRNELIRRVSVGNLDEVEKLGSWIFSPLGYEASQKPLDFAMALYNYCYNPDSFSLSSIDTIDGLLPSIVKWIGASPEKAQPILSLLIKELSTANDFQGFKATIQKAERIEMAGINISSVKDYAKGVFTPFLVSSVEHLSSSLSQLGAETLKKYGDLEKLPKLEKVIDDIVNLPVALELKEKVINFIEPDAEKRVSVYEKKLQNNPGVYPKYKDLLSWDEAIVSQHDYFKVLKDHLTDKAIAPLLFEDCMRKFKASEYKTWLPFFKEFSQKNTEFGKLIGKNGDNAYRLAYDACLRDIKEKESVFKNTAVFIKDNVLGFNSISDDFKSRKDWKRLYDVLNCTEPKEGFNQYYQTAKAIGFDEAMNKALPHCLASLESAEEIKNAVHRLLDNKIITGKELLDKVCKNRDIDAKSKCDFLTAVAQCERFDQKRIEDYLYKGFFGVEQNKKAIKNYFKKYFPELLAEQKKAQNENWFQAHKKQLVIGGCILFVLIIAFVVFMLFFRPMKTDNKIKNQVQPNTTDTIPANQSEKTIVLPMEPVGEEEPKKPSDVLSETGPIDNN